MSHGPPSPLPPSPKNTRALPCSLSRVPLPIVQPPFNFIMNFQMNLNVIGSFHLDDFTIVSEELDSAWMTPANVNARLETYRKGAFTIQFMDSTGKALPAGALLVRAGGRGGAGLLLFVSQPAASHAITCNGRGHLLGMAFEASRALSGSGLTHCTAFPATAVPFMAAERDSQPQAPRLCIR